MKLAVFPNSDDPTWCKKSVSSFVLDSNFISQRLFLCKNHSLTCLLQKLSHCAFGLSKFCCFSVNDITDYWVQWGFVLTDLNGALPALSTAAGMFSSNFTLSLIAVRRLAFVLETFACDAQVPHRHWEMRHKFTLCAFERRLSFVHYRAPPGILCVYWRPLARNKKTSSTLLCVTSKTGSAVPNYTSC